MRHDEVDVTPTPDDEPGRGEDRSVVRHEEELRVGKSVEEIGAIRARKVVETEDVDERAPREVEQVELERAALAASDSGEIETLPDGSISIPVFEEELVVSRRPVLRERVIVRKRRVTEEQRIEETLRRERVEVEADPGVEVEMDSASASEGREGMATTDPARRESETQSVRPGLTTAIGRKRRERGLFDGRRFMETKPFFKTSEFLAFLLGVLALAICTAVFDNLNLERAMTLITALTAAYVLSRGIAKAGKGVWDDD